MSPEATESLDAIAARALDGDRHALAVLCRRLQGPIFRLALRMLGSQHDAEDATQEILVQVITHLASFEGRSTLLTWAYKIASRHLLHTPRRRRELLAISVEEATARIDEQAGLASHASISPAEAPRLEREVQLECTQGMLLCLSRPERLAFILSDVLGASARQAAEMCEVSEQAFRQRLSRARKQLRPLLAERCGLADSRLPCRCAAHVGPSLEAKLVRPDRLRLSALERDASDARLARADEELGRLRRFRHVFDDSIAAPRELWDRLRASCPELLGEAR